MSKLETNIIDTVAGTTNLTLGSTNTSTITIPNGKLTGHNYPAFEVYTGATSAALTHATWTKIQHSIERFDTNNMYDTSTYRFTPTIAGKYYMYLIILYIKMVHYITTQQTMLIQLMMNMKGHLCLLEL